MRSRGSTCGPASLFREVFESRHRAATNASSQCRPIHLSWCDSCSAERRHFCRVLVIGTSYSIETCGTKSIGELAPRASCGGTGPLLDGGYIIKIRPIAIGLFCLIRPFTQTAVRNGKNSVVNEVFCPKRWDPLSHFSSASRVDQEWCKVNYYKM